jgi:hypothetical protein
MDFPIFKTKMEGKEQKFNLTDAKERKDYFYYKAGEEIEKLKEYVKDNTFIVYLLGKKIPAKALIPKCWPNCWAPTNLSIFPWAI